MASVPPYLRLYVNIDHVATVRQARKTIEPDPLAAAQAAERGGADGITAHLREDRRHIQDSDIERLAREIRTVLNLEIACTAEMLRIAEDLRPHQVTFVPERREEITTEGGLDVEAASRALESGVRRLKDAGIRVSLFIAPDSRSVSRSRDLGADAVELHTGSYSHDPGPATTGALRSAAREASGAGMYVHAGHGLTTGNVEPIASIPEVEELNIGHHIVSRSVMVGMETAVREMIEVIRSARR